MTIPSGVDWNNWQGVSFPSYQNRQSNIPITGNNLNFMDRESEMPPSFQQTYSWSGSLYGSDTISLKNASLFLTLANSISDPLKGIYQTNVDAVSTEKVGKLAGLIESHTLDWKTYHIDDTEQQQLQAMAGLLSNQQNLKLLSSLDHHSNDVSTQDLELLAKQSGNGQSISQMGFDILQRLLNGSLFKKTSDKKSQEQSQESQTQDSNAVLLNAGDSQQFLADIDKAIEKGQLSGAQMQAAAEMIVSEGVQVLPNSGGFSMNANLQTFLNRQGSTPFGKMILQLLKQHLEILPQANPENPDPVSV